MTERSALLLGSDRYVVAACGRHEIETVVLYGPSLRDGNGLPALAPCVHPVFVEDQTNPERVLAALDSAGFGAFRPDCVATTYEHAVVTAGLLGHYLGARAIDPAIGVRFRDKSRQKAVVAATGIRTASCTLIEDIRDLRGVRVPIGGGVVKPVSGAGTRSTARVATDAELQAFVDEQRRSGPGSRTFVLESFVQGEEWVADGVVIGGKVAFWCLGTYAEPCLDAVTRSNPVTMRRFDPVEDAPNYAAAGPIVLGALSALGHRDGVFHMELFHDPESGRITFSECAARRGGGLTQEEVRCKFDIDLAELGLLAILGAPVEPKPTVRAGVVGITYLPTREGTVLACPSRAEVEGRSYVEFARLETPVGHRTHAGLSDTNTRMGTVLLLAPTVAEFEAAAADVRRWFDERLDVLPPDLTKAQLLARQRERWPDGRYDDRLYEPVR